VVVGHDGEDGKKRRTSLFFRPSSAKKANFSPPSARAREKKKSTEREGAKSERRDAARERALVKETRNQLRIDEKRVFNGETGARFSTKKRAKERE
jgi:hypothetical protein